MKERTITVTIKTSDCGRYCHWYCPCCSDWGTRPRCGLNGDYLDPNDDLAEEEEYPYIRTTHCVRSSEPQSE
jgi:hypothetical protein